MAFVANKNYFVQALVDNDKAFKHHESVSALWQTKWQRLANAGIYPFVDGMGSDFEPIFEQLSQAYPNGDDVLFRPDDYAKPFLPVGQALVDRAREAEASGSTEAAKGLYLRAAAVYRIARFPIVRSELSRQAWEKGKAAYLAGGKYLNPPNQEVLIPFTHRSLSSGDSSSDIPVYVRVPKGVAPDEGWPVILFICGLDAYRTDHTNRTTAHVQAGFAIISAEIPGTGDCPASPGDPSSPDRLWTSILEWIQNSGKSDFGLNPSKVIARGVSTGGYYAMRIAHTHSNRLFASVSQGGWSHNALDPKWIKAMNHMEYPFALADALAQKFGFQNVEEWIKADTQDKFSLASDPKWLEQKSCRLLLINGLNDSIFPIEDSLLVACRGRIKDVRFMEGRGHMGNPGAEEMIYEWILEALRQG